MMSFSSAYFQLYTQLYQLAHSNAAIKLHIGIAVKHAEPFLHGIIDCPVSPSGNSLSEAPKGPTQWEFLSQGPFRASTKKGKNNETNQEGYKIGD